MFSDNTLNNLARVGDKIILKISTNENINAPVVSFTNLTGSPTVSGNYKNWTITQEVQITDPDATVEFTLDFTDLAGNAGAQATAVTSGLPVEIDNNGATLSLVSLTSDNADDTLAKDGNVVTLSIEASSVTGGGPIDTFITYNLMNSQGASLASEANSFLPSATTKLVTVPISSKDINGALSFTID